MQVGRDLIGPMLGPGHRQRDAAEHGRKAGEFVLLQVQDAGARGLTFGQNSCPPLDLLGVVIADGLGPVGRLQVERIALIVLGVGGGRQWRRSGPEAQAFQAGGKARRNRVGILKRGQVDEFDPRHRLGSISGMSGWDGPGLALAKQEGPVPVGDGSVGPYAADMKTREHASWLFRTDQTGQAPISRGQRASRPDRSYLGRDGSWRYH